MRLVDADKQLSDLNWSDRSVFTHAEVALMIVKSPTVEAIPERRGVWEKLNGFLTPGGDPLYQCPYCHSEKSRHLNGVESRKDWAFCPACGAELIYVEV